MQIHYNDDTELIECQGQTKRLDVSTSFAERICGGSLNTPKRSYSSSHKAYLRRNDSEFNVGNGFLP